MDTSFSLKKFFTSIWTIVIFCVLLAIAVLWCRRRGECHRLRDAYRQDELYLQRKALYDAQCDARRRELRDRLRREGWRMTDVGENLFRPTADQSNEVAWAFEHIADAYKRGQIDVMRKYMGECPDCVTNMVQHVYVKLRQSCSKLFYDGFINVEELKEFLQTSEFERYVEVNRMMACFLGNLDLRRGAHSDGMVLWEAIMLKRLKDYQDKFRREGKADLERSASRFVKEWVDQIESDDGLTHSWMWRQVSFQCLLVEEKKMTLKQLHDVVIHRGVGTLKAFGYTPKWLDEFSVITNSASASLLSPFVFPCKDGRLPL